MSDYQYFCADEKNIDELLAAIETGWKKVAEVCLDRRKFTMTIPPQADDYDMVIGDAFRAARELHARLKRRNTMEAKP